MPAMKGRTKKKNKQTTVGVDRDGNRADGRQNGPGRGLGERILGES